MFARDEQANFDFISSTIHPDNTLIVLPFIDDYSFGILQSGLHWEWFKARCSTLGAGFRYTSDTVFDTFPWPQFDRSSRRKAQTSSRKDQSLVTSAATMEKIRAVAEAAVALRALRRDIMRRNGWSLRELYRTLETPGDNKLRDAHETLDATVRAAYGMKDTEDILAFLFRLNLDLAAKEAKGESILPPGLPAFVPDPGSFVTTDCVAAG